MIPDNRNPLAIIHGARALHDSLTAPNQPQLLEAAVEVLSLTVDVPTLDEDARAAILSSVQNIEMSVAKIHPWIRGIITPVAVPQPQPGHRLTEAERAMAQAIDAGRTAVNWFRTSRGVAREEAARQVITALAEGFSPMDLGLTCDVELVAILEATNLDKWRAEFADIVS
jgi:hypothetical protein